MKRLLVVGLLVAVAGCVTAKKDLVATGGSRSDGTVELSYEQAGFETVQLDTAQGLEAARARCLAWGYSGAEAFGGQTRQCQVSSDYGCSQWLVTITYQCTGGGPSAAAS